MTDPTQPLTVMHGSPEWRQLVTRFWRRRCRHCQQTMPTDAPSNKYFCSSRCADRARRADAASNLDRKDAA